MKEINEKELEQSAGGKATYTYNCPNFVLKDGYPPFLAGLASNQCVNCAHFTGDSKTICDIQTD